MAHRKFSLSTAKTLSKAIPATGAALAAALIAASITDDVGDVVKQHYITESTPIWESRGKLRLMDDYGDVYRGQRVRESIYDTLFGAPERFVGKAMDAAGSSVGESMIPAARANVGGVLSALSSTPEVQALGRRNARELIEQVTAVAPSLTRKAPAVVLPILQNAIDSGSNSLRPELLKVLADTERL